MARELNPIDVANTPDLLRIAEEVRTSGVARILSRGGEELAVVSPIRVAKRRRKSGIITKSDPFWDIVGIAKSDGPTDVSENKHKYLAGVYADNHE